MDRAKSGETDDRPGERGGRRGKQLCGLCVYRVQRIARLTFRVICTYDVGGLDGMMREDWVGLG